MWADNNETMLVPSMNKRETPVAGTTFWCSCKLGVVHVFVVSVSDTHAVVSRDGREEQSVRLCDSSFYATQPFYKLS